MPSSMRDEGKWREAKAAVRTQYPDLSEEDARFYKLTTTVYKRMHGRISAAKGFMLIFGRAPSMARRRRTV